MKKTLDVDVYGKCGKLKCSRDDETGCYQNVEHNYKFYLSFEVLFHDGVVIVKFLYSNRVVFFLSRTPCVRTTSRRSSSTSSTTTSSPSPTQGRTSRWGNILLKMSPIIALVQALAPPHSYKLIILIIIIIIIIIVILPCLGPGPAPLLHQHPGLCLRVQAVKIPPRGEDHLLS